MEAFPSYGLQALERLSRAGYQAWLVGGCVRDALRGVAPHDCDVATDALPHQVHQVFAGERVADTGVRHGTLTVVLEGEGVEITTFRREGDYSDHRHPDTVAFTTVLEEDLARRDFTMNAMAWRPGELADPFGGQRDMAAGLIRCVGDPRRRFREDALRILRGVRFAAVLGYGLEEETARAVKEQAELLDWVSRERVYGELKRLVCGDWAEKALLDFPHVITQVVEELRPAVGFDQRTPYHRYDVYTHIAKVVQKVPPKPALRLAALLHDVGKPATFTLDERGVGHFHGHNKAGAILADQALRRLRADNATREHVVTLVGRHGLRLPVEERVVRRWLSRLGPELFFDLMTLDRADNLSKAPDVVNLGEDHWRDLDAMARSILARQECLSVKDLEVDGRDALAMGLEGREIGQALKWLLDAVVERHLPNRREELLEALAGWKDRS